jgi:hypothetical protein
LEKGLDAYGTGNAYGRKVLAGVEAIKRTGELQFTGAMRNRHYGLLYSCFRCKCDQVIESLEEAVR